MGEIEHRSIRAPIRTDGDGRTFEAVVMNYGQVDDYNTIFDPGVFTDSLEERLPRITWAHDWKEPIGRYVDYRDTAEDLTLIGELDDFDAVPRARQAMAQLRSGTIDQFSVGFARDATVEDDNGRTHFTKARLDEAALVLAGAVPGTKLLSVRSALTEDFVVNLGRRVSAGEITKAEALATIDLLSSEDRTAHPIHRTGYVDTPWDGPAAMAAAPNDAGVLWHMSAWRDGNGDPEAKTSYKFPHHAPRMGSPANLAGVRNALARLSQADIPASDVAGVRAHLQAHLAEADRSAELEDADRVLDRMGWQR